MTIPTTVYKVASDVRFRVIDDEGVAIRVTAAQLVVVNEVGARIMDLFDGSRSVSAIIEVIVDEFDAARGEVETDVNAYVAELVEAGLLTVAT